MNLKIFLFPLMLLPLLTVKQCGCDKKPNYPEYYFTEEFLDYTYFPEESWWIYEDSVSTEVDTVTVVQRTMSFELTEDLGYAGEYFSVTLNSSCYKQEYIFRGSTHNYGYQSADGFFLPAEDENKTFIHTAYLKIYDSLLIKSSYMDSVKLYTNLLQYGQLEPVKAYWKRGIGMVKKEMQDGRVWELKEYHINR